jgi:DNA-binding IclR family transcriptional regulator
MYEAPTVKRAFQILDLIARRDRRLTISDLSKELSISKSTVCGITKALERTGAIVRDAVTKRYSLGMALFELGRRAYARVDLRDIARPIMEDLMRSTRQSVFLGTRSGDHISIIDIVESTQDLKVTAQIGSRLPLFAGATGKIVLASMAEDEVLQLINNGNLRRDTEKSITDPKIYLEEIRKARGLGYAFDDEEYMHGVRAVAVLIPARGWQMLAIWAVGFTQTMKDESMTAIAVKTKDAAAAISQKLKIDQLEKGA